MCHHNTNPQQAQLLFSHSLDDSLIDKKNSLTHSPPIQPLTCLYALFIGVFKSHIGLAWIVHCLERWTLSISSLLGPQPLGFYACVLVCESECTLSQEDRAFIHSTLKVCRWSAAVALTVLASVCLTLSLALCPIFQTGMLACATRSQGFGPLTGRPWGIRQVRTKKNEGEKEATQSGALEGSTELLALPHWESCSVELNDHAWISSRGWCGASQRTLWWKRKLESQLHEKKKNSWERERLQRSRHYIVHVCWPFVWPTNHASPFYLYCLSYCCDQLRKTTGSSRAPPEVNAVLHIYRTFSERWFDCLIKWDCTLILHLCWATFLYNKQSLLVQMSLNKKT